MSAHVHGLAGWLSSRQRRLTPARLLGAFLALAVLGPASALASAPSATTSFVAPRLDTTARLNASVNPNGEATGVHFEYGTAGPCSANPCQSTATVDIGSATYPDQAPLTGAELSGLEPMD